MQQREITTTRQRSRAVYSSRQELDHDLIDKQTADFFNQGGSIQIIEQGVIALDSGIKKQSAAACRRNIKKKMAAMHVRRKACKKKVAK